MKTFENELVNDLNDFLANLQIFYQNLRGLHWNIKGPQFFVLHAKFESYYDQTAEWVDEVAERILTVGGTPVHAFSDYIKTSEIKEVKNVSDANGAVKVVKENFELLLGKMYKIQVKASANGDEGTNGMFSGYIGGTEKTLWMLKAYFG